MLFVVFLHLFHCPPLLPTEVQEIERCPSILPELWIPSPIDPQRMDSRKKEAFPYVNCLNDVLLKK